MQTRSNGIEVIDLEGNRKGLRVSHLDSEITFIYPPVRGTCSECALQLESNVLYQPTFSEIVSLVHRAWKNPKEKYSKGIIQLMKYSWIRGFTGILYISQEGLYIQDNPKISNGRVLMDKNDLVKKLDSKDTSVRFVSLGYKTKYQSAKELVQKDFIVALTGSEEQAEKLGEIADKYGDESYLWSFNSVKYGDGTYLCSFNSVNEPVIRVSGLGSDFNCYRLYVNCNIHVADGDSYAFGKLKEAA